MILANERSKPIFSIGNAKRFNYSTGFNTPGPDSYSPSNVESYKYKTSTHWKIGTSSRPPLSSNERYTYYNHRYSPLDDFATLPKKWNRTIGGSIGGKGDCMTERIDKLRPTQPFLVLET